MKCVNKKVENQKNKADIKKIDNYNITKEDDLNIENDANIQENDKYTMITLVKEKESFDIGKIHLEFNCVLIEGEKGYFNYVLNIKYDGQNIKSIYFYNKENNKIWSNSMVVNFKIYRVYNV